MKTETENNLTRRVFFCYLLFCLMSLTSLGAGVALVSYRSSVSEFDNASLLMISAAQSQFTIATTVDDSVGSRKLVEQFAEQHGLEYCAILSPDGSYVTHTNRSLVGIVHRSSPGKRSTIGNVERIATRNPGQPETVEYSIRLEHAEKHCGTLLVARKQPTIWQTLQSITTELPLALACPALLLALGAFLIYRAIAPIAVVHDQLSVFAAQPSIYAAEFRHLPVRDAMTIGWNALVDELKQHVGENDFDERLENMIQSRQSSGHCEVVMF